MNHTNIATVLLMLAMIMILLSLSACNPSTIKDCEFNPGVDITQKEKISEAERKSGKKPSKLESDLPVKVSPKGEVTCSF